MKDEDFFSERKIAIVGLGLMGGSIALGLQGRSGMLLAVDPDPETCALAIRENIVDHISMDLEEILPQADAIILAAPVNAILALIPHLPALHHRGAIILDIGSTKVEICRALSDLPSRFEPIGGHPMCGKAVGGLAHAEADLFRGAAFALTPLNRTTEGARLFAETLVEALGAIPIWLGPNTHDQWVAATSHLPYLLSSALTLATPVESSHLVGPGFRSTSRLAGSPSSVMLPILETNRENVLEAIACFRRQLDGIEAALSRRDYQALGDVLEHGSLRRALLLGSQK